MPIDNLCNLPPGNIRDGYVNHVLMRKVKRDRHVGNSVIPGGDAAIYPLRFAPSMFSGHHPRHFRKWSSPYAAIPGSCENIAAAYRKTLHVGIREAVIDGLPQLPVIRSQKNAVVGPREDVSIAYCERLDRNIGNAGIGFGPACCIIDGNEDTAPVGCGKNRIAAYRKRKHTGIRKPGIRQLPACAVIGGTEYTAVLCPCQNRTAALRKRRHIGK
jgi:hypothetical protein